jgi:hypothetical protein
MREVFETFASYVLLIRGETFERISRGSPGSSQLPPATSHIARIRVQTREFYNYRDICGYSAASCRDAEFTLVALGPSEHAASFYVTTDSRTPEILASTRQ